MIREMTEADIPRVVELHRRYITSSIFARLTSSFLHTLYRASIESEHGINYVIEEDSRVYGFISVSANLSAQFDYTVQKYRGRLICACIASALLKPWLIPRILESVAYSKKSGASEIRAEMLFIAIEPEARKKGNAKALIQTALSDYARRGLNRVKVSTEKDNLVVQKLLESLGFHIHNEFTFHSKPMLLYTATLDEEGRVVRG